MKRMAVAGILVAGVLLLTSLDAGAGPRDHRHSVPSDPFISSSTYAENKKYFYGRPGKGRYGERSTVMNEDAARGVLREYYQNSATIGRIREKKHYFDAEIMDKEGRVVDRVIIDRRSGRIRSAY